MKSILLGNEAIARGAWEAGVRVATAYPGTPSTEITETLAKYPEVYAEWSPNEKVALEVAAGASAAGVRAMCSMKHVGLNVAADPLFTLSYTGVGGGLVIVVADDPGMHSSQNEQDSRYYALAAHIPMLEPSDSAEARAFMMKAFTLSEERDTPVLVRMTTRVAHARSLVTTGPRQEAAVIPYARNIGKFVMMPAMARRRHVVVEERMRALTDDANAMEDMNPILRRGSEVGVITSGVAYQYVREALPEASILKLGMVWPLPIERIRQFAGTVDALYVVEELEPFLETHLKAAGLRVRGKELFSVQGEYSARKIAAAIGGGAPEARPAASDLPARPPALCPGCPHRGIFYVLSKLKVTVTGDIGCYTLGALPPLSAMDTCVCMGASIGMALGMEKALGRESARKIAAVIGDSTFIHSGITGLIDTVYSGGRTTVIILDNATTGMTGHQQHPATGLNIYGKQAPRVDLEALCRAAGATDVAVVDPYDLRAAEAAIRRALEHDGPSVVIARRACALLDRKSRGTPASVDAARCVGCRRCIGLGCPAISMRDGRAAIDPALCTGCGLCAGVCPADAIGGGNGSCG